MKFSGILLAGAKKGAARRPQTDPVPFQELLPLELKKTVSGKSDKTSDPVCLQEMAIMFSCLKANEFDQAECLKEISSFKKCYGDYQSNAAVLKEQKRKGILIPGEKKLTHRQVNKLLQSFPPPKKQPFPKA